MCVEDVCWDWGCVLRLRMCVEVEDVCGWCVEVEDVCWGWGCVLRLRMCVEVKDVCWGCVLRLRMCVEVKDVGWGCVLRLRMFVEDVLRLRMCVEVEDVCWGWGCVLRMCVEVKDVWLMWMFFSSKVNLLQKSILSQTEEQSRLAMLEQQVTLVFKVRPGICLVAIQTRPDVPIPLCSLPLTTLSDPAVGQGLWEREAGPPGHAAPAPKGPEGAPQGPRPDHQAGVCKGPYQNT